MECTRVVAAAVVVTALGTVAAGVAAASAAAAPWRRARAAAAPDGAEPTHPAVTRSVDRATPQAAANRAW